MPSEGIPKKNARLFRITAAVLATVSGGLAALLFVTSHTVLAWIFVVSAAGALVDAIVGWRKSGD